ncbi:MAG: hypothetical protein ACTSVI_07915 [Promethearchaeota archaeon]
MFRLQDVLFISLFDIHVDDTRIIPAFFNTKINIITMKMHLEKEKIITEDNILKTAGLRIGHSKIREEKLETLSCHDTVENTKAFFKDIQELGNVEGNDDELDEITKFILEIAWNNPIFEDLPVMKATNDSDNQSPGSSDRDGHHEDWHDINHDDLVIKSFLKPRAPLDSLVKPEEQLQEKNVSGMFSAVYNMSLKKLARQMKL